MNKKITILIFVASAIFIILIGIRSIWRAYYNQPLHRIELNLPNAAGEKDFIVFSLPKGEYIIKAEIKEELLNDDLPRIIRYKVAVPKQNFIIDQEAKIDFIYRVKEVWLKSFEIKDKIGQGTFSVEMVTPSKSAAKVKVFIIKKVLFKTVE